MIAQLLLQGGSILLCAMEVLARADGIIEGICLHQCTCVTFPRIVVVIQLPDLAGYLAYHPASQACLCQGQAKALLRAPELVVVLQNTRDHSSSQRLQEL